MIRVLRLGFAVVFAMTALIVASLPSAAQPEPRTCDSVSGTEECAEECRCLSGRHGSCLLICQTIYYTDPEPPLPLPPCPWAYEAIPTPPSQCQVRW